MLDIGGGLGALIVHTDADMHGVEVEISPSGTDAQRSHKEVLERLNGGRPAYTAVFDRLPAGAYTLWVGGVARVRDVVVRGGTIAELDWRPRSWRLNTGSAGRPRRRRREGRDGGGPASRRSPASGLDVSKPTRSSSRKVASRATPDPWPRDDAVSAIVAGDRRRYAAWRRRPAGALGDCRSRAVAYRDRRLGDPVPTALLRGCLADHQLARRHLVEHPLAALLARRALLGEIPRGHVSKLCHSHHPWRQLGGVAVNSCIDRAARAAVPPVLPIFVSTVPQLRAGGRDLHRRPARRRLRCAAYPIEGGPVPQRSSYTEGTPNWVDLRRPTPAPRRRSTRRCSAGPTTTWR